jgi:hypothetical protein
LDAPDAAHEHAITRLGHRHQQVREPLLAADERDRFGGGVEGRAAVVALVPLAGGAQQRHRGAAEAVLVRFGVVDGGLLV